MGMNWTSLSVSKYFGARHSELLDDKLKRYRASTLDTRIQLADRVNELKESLMHDLGTILLATLIGGLGSASFLTLLLWVAKTFA